MSTQQPPLSLHRLTFVSTLNQDLVADYLTYLRFLDLRVDSYHSSTLPACLLCRREGRPFSMLHTMRRWHTICTHATAHGAFPSGRALLQPSCPNQ
jgi:hypothetical protein